MYDFTFNPVRKVYIVWKRTGSTWETVKSFKTEKAAAAFCKKHNG